MGPISHFLVGLLCGAAIGAMALAFRRRWALYLPAFVLACGFWAEAPGLLGARAAHSGLANVFFGYAWLHAGVQGREDVAFVFALVIANVLLLGPLSFLTWTTWMVDTVRWERADEEEAKRRSGSPRAARRARDMKPGGGSTD